MKHLSLPLLFLAASSLPICAADFSYKGNTVTSQVSETIVECNAYQVLIKKEHFPYKYEMVVPKAFHIKEFFGSAATIRKEAFILPNTTIIPQPNEISTIKGKYPRNRTYLPSSAVCKGNTLIVSYWSGGNCKECEAFVQFEIVGGMLTKPQKVDYSHVKDLK